jgi:glycopeptide antibiotics resistance protein
VILLLQLIAGRKRQVLAGAVVTLYACLTVAVVLFPLPGPGTRPPAQTVQPIPFQWAMDVGEELGRKGLSIQDSLSTLAFQQVVMNVLLFLPLGVFAKVLWRRSLTGAALLGFAASLLIEITQLTATFGTAPFVYRIFDVDDLINNTAGAALGWIAATVLLTARLRLRQPHLALSSSSERLLTDRARSGGVLVACGLPVPVQRPLVAPETPDVV